MRMRRSAPIMVVMVLALFLVGNTAHAGWLDWVWPFGSPRQGPQEQTPDANAQTPPPPGGMQPPPGGMMPPPGGDQGFQPQPPQQQPQPQQQAQPQPQPQPQPMQGQPGQPNQFNQQGGNQGQQGQFQPGQPGQQGQQPSGRFFCNSLGREATAQECDGADKAKGFQAGQPNQPSTDQNFKPPFPGNDTRQPGDEERMKKEQEERFRMESEQSRKQVEEKMRQEDKMRQPQQGQMPFPGQGQTDGKFPGQGATQGNFPGGPEGQRPMMNQEKQQQPQFNFDGEQERPQVFIDPQFIKQTQREISDQTRELNRLLKAAKKLAGAEASVAEIQGLLGKIDEFKVKVKSAQGEDLQSAIEDFHDAQIWESLNALRAKIELPKQLNEFEKQLKRVGKLGTQSSFKKLAEFGVDMEKVKTDIASFSEKVTNIRSLLAAGNADDAQEAMQEIWQGDFNPGDIEGALQQMRGMTDGLRRIRNKEILAQVKEVFEPVIEAMNNGDYREANQLLNELRFEMQRIFSQLQRLNAKGTLSSDLRKKLQAFDDRIQQKLQQSDNEEGASAATGEGEGF